MEEQKAQDQESGFPLKWFIFFGLIIFISIFLYKGYEEHRRTSIELSKHQIMRNPNIYVGNNRELQEFRRQVILERRKQMLARQRRFIRLQSSELCQASVFIDKAIRAMATRRYRAHCRPYLNAFWSVLQKAGKEKIVNKKVFDECYACYGNAYFACSKISTQFSQACTKGVLVRR